jgi:hypothetical protein
MAAQLPSWQTAPYRTMMPYIDKGAAGLKGLLNSLGPDVGNRLYGLINAGAELSPAQDFVGALQSSGETMHGLMTGDPQAAALGAGNTIGNLAMLAVPGSLAGAKSVAQGGQDMMRQAFHGDETLSQGMEFGAVPELPAKIDPGPYANQPAGGVLDNDVADPRFAEGRSLKAEEMIASGRQQGLMNQPDLPPQPLSMYEAKPHVDPRHQGTGVDRSGFSHVRYVPEAGASPKVTEAINRFEDNTNGAKDQLLADIRAGEALGGNDWYNTEELRDWFIAELGEKRGHDEWKEFIDLMAATSTGNKVDSNFGVASFYRMLGENASDFGKMERWRPGDDPKIIAEGYGHKMQKGQAKNVSAVKGGEWEGLAQPGVPPASGSHAENAKPKGFRGSLLGNTTNIAADVHFTRYMGMASGKSEWLENSAEISQELATTLRQKYGASIEPYILRGNSGGPRLRAKQAVDDGPADMSDFAEEATVWQQMPNANEYAAFENYIKKLGDELGMTGAQVQANLWMGAAKRTGVADSSQGTFMELIRARAAKRAEAEGLSMPQVLQRMIREKGLLAVPGAAAAGGLMQPGEEQPY